MYAYVYVNTESVCSVYFYKWYRKRGLNTIPIKLQCLLVSLRCFFKEYTCAFKISCQLPCHRVELWSALNVGFSCRAVEGHIFRIRRTSLVDMKHLHRLCWKGNCGKEELLLGGHDQGFWPRVGTTSVTAQAPHADQCNSHACSLWPAVAEICVGWQLSYRQVALPLGLWPCPLVFLFPPNILPCH